MQTHSTSVTKGRRLAIMAIALVGAILVFDPGAASGSVNTGAYVNRWTDRLSGSCARIHKPAQYRMTVHREISLQSPRRKAYQSYTSQAQSRPEQGLWRRDYVEFRWSKTYAEDWCVNGKRERRYWGKYTEFRFVVQVGTVTALGPVWQKPRPTVGWRSTGWLYRDYPGKNDLETGPPKGADLRHTTWNFNTGITVNW